MTVGNAHTMGSYLCHQVADSMHGRSKGTQVSLLMYYFHCELPYYFGLPATFLQTDAELRTTASTSLHAKATVMMCICVTEFFHPSVAYVF